MEIPTIHGHEALRQKFSKLISESQFPQTSIFYGLNGTGKKKVALEVAQILFCEETQKPCGTCQSCQMVFAQTHPDLYLIQATPPKSKTSKKNQDADDDKKDKGSENLTIKVDDVSEVKSRLIHRPLMAKYQVILIDDADLMTTVTANSLLKVLEEPKPHQIFILITSQFHRILSTLRSRSAKFYFGALTADAVKKIISKNLEGEELPSAENLVFYNQAFNGSIVNILKAIRSNLSPEIFQKLISSQKSFIQTNQIIAEVIENQADLRLFLQGLRTYYLMHAKQSQGTGDLSVFDKITAAERQLKRHIQKEFVLENLFL